MSQLNVTYFECEEYDIYVDGRSSASDAASDISDNTEVTNSLGTIDNRVRRRKKKCVERVIDPTLREIKETIPQRHHSEELSLRQSYKEEKAKIDPKGATHVTLKTVSKCKTGHSRSLVSSICNFGKLLKTERFAGYSETRRRHQMFVGLLSDHTAVFISQVAKTLLKEKLPYILAINRVHYAVPVEFTHCRLVTLLAVLSNKEIPLVFAFTSKLNKSTLVLLLREVIRIEPLWNPPTIIADYKDFIRSAIREVFPCSVLTNWFHYVQSIRLKLHELRLIDTILNDDTLHKHVKMALAIPLLPSDLVQAGCEFTSYLIISSKIEKHKDRFQQLFKYIQKYWISEVGAENFALEYNPVRINNYCEEYTGYLVQLLHNRAPRKTRPTLFTFASGLAKIDNVYVTTYENLMNRRSSPNSTFEVETSIRDPRISNAMHKFRCEEISMHEYLEALSYATREISRYEIDGEFSSCDDVAETVNADDIADTSFLLRDDDV